MPTAARLFAALAFAGVAFFASEFFKFLLPEGSPVGMLTLVNTLIGALSGWMVMGRLAGNGYYAAAGYGLRTMFVTVFYVLLAWALYEMIKKSLRKAYDGPVEALEAMMSIISEYVVLGALDPQVSVTVVFGGILAALLSEWASTRWN